MCALWQKGVSSTTQAKHILGPHLQAFLAAQSAEGFTSKVLRFGQLFWDQSVSRVDLQYSQKSG